MIKLLDVYIGKAILFAVLLTLMTLLGISGIIKFVEQLNSVGEGSYGLFEAGMYTLLRVPNEMTIFFPMAALLGALIGLGTLASSSELTVMQAAGMSRFNIVVSVLKSAIPLMFVVMLVGEYVAPPAEQSAKELRVSALSGGNLVHSQRGLWAKEQDYFVHIGLVERRDKLRNLTAYQFDENRQLVRIVFAHEARYADDGWWLEDIELTNFNDDQISHNRVNRTHMKTALTPNKLEVVALEPLDLSITGLYDYVSYLKENQQASGDYELAFWRKLLAPVSVVVMMLLALSFVFGSMRSVTMGARIMLGVITGFLFYLSNETLGPLALVYSLPPLLGALGPSFIFATVAMFQLRRA